MPAGGGDPYIQDLKGEWFPFKGKHGARYTMYRDAAVHLSGRVSDLAGDTEGRQFFCGLDLDLPGGWHVFAGDGKVHVFKPGEYHVVLEPKVCTLDAPGHHGKTQDEPHPLMGVPHLNFDIPALPPSEGASGLCVEGAASTEHVDDYLIAEY